jgi:hypothetical protein
MQLIDEKDDGLEKLLGKEIAILLPLMRELQSM